MPRTAIALGFEGMLINNARTVRPRPGLGAFLAFRDERFARVVIYDSDARDVAAALADEGHLSRPLLGCLEYFTGWFDWKDLSYLSDVGLDEVVLVDHDRGWIVPEQRDGFEPVTEWDGDPDDRELPRVRAVLQQRLAASVPGCVTLLAAFS